MGQDIREMFRKEEHISTERLKSGHQNRFEARLDEAFPEKKKKSNFYQILQIAAILVVALGIGGFFFFNDSGQNPGDENTQIVDTPVEEKGSEEETTPVDEYRLSDVSPQFKKIEDYYMASLNLQLAKLDMTPENKELIDAFMTKLETLDDEYKALNAEIQETGINEETVEAMISNLQLRLDLLTKLKTKLKEIQQSKDNGNENYKA